MAALPESFREVAKRHPERTALVSGGQAYTYQGLMDAVATLAGRLRDEGMTRVGLCGDNSAAWVLADLACLTAGLVCVPVPVFFSGEQVAHLTRQAGIQALLWSEPGDDRAPLGQGVWITRLADAPEAKPLPPGTAKVTYTSGSTGTPKGVCLSQQQMAATARTLQQRLKAVAPSQHLCLLPLSTLLENIAGVYLPLLMGATLRVESLATLGMTGSSGVDVSTLAAALNRWQPESLILVPELARLLVATAEAGVITTNAFRFLAVGGGKVAPALLSRGRHLGLPLYEGYGLSECGSVVALNVPGDDQIGCAGRPLDHVEVRVDSKRHILVRGNTHLGYLGDNNVPETWLDTGDLGEIDPSGFLKVDGRSRNLLITGFGRNVSPEWLEAELLHGLGVQQAVVFGDGEVQPRALVAALPGQSSADLGA